MKKVYKVGDVFTHRGSDDFYILCCVYNYNYSLINLRDGYHWDIPTEFATDDGVFTVDEFNSLVGDEVDFDFVGNMFSVNFKNCLT